MDTCELRAMQANDLRSIVGHTDLLLVGSASVDPEIRDGRFDHGYGRLAERMYGGFAIMAAASGNERLAGLASNPNVLNGLYVLTNILRYGPKAYGIYLEDNPEPKTPVKELGHIMGRSAAMLKTFADLEQRANIVYEVNFGLLQHPPVYEEVPFVIEPDEKDELAFKPSPDTLKRSRIEVAGRRLQGDLSSEHNPVERCPAIGRVMTAFWKRAIEECVSDPELFEADLAVARVGSLSTAAQP